MIGKILFFDDEFKVWDTPHVISNTVTRLIKDNSLTRGFCFFPKTFEEAVKEIINAGDGKDYSWFIIDRNLGSFDDIKNAGGVKVCGIEFTKAFFDNFKGFEGDYLYFLLRKGGVPLEKICFLTANDCNNPGEKSELKATPFVFTNEMPQVIVKNSAKSSSSDSSKTALDDDADSAQQCADDDETKLYDLIKNSLELQICFRHKVIFGSQKIMSIFKDSGLLDSFKQLLIKIERNESFQPQDGTVLRNMLELILEKWKSQFCLDEATIRSVLNNSYNCWAKKHQLTYDYWLKAYGHCGHLPYSGDHATLVTYFISERQKCTDPKKLKILPLPKDLAVDVIEFSSFVLEGMLNYCYRGKNTNSSPTNLPPKYVFAYVDNIYTVTSEWSSHGHNLTTTQDLSPEGWKALIFGMLQILQYLA